jgi:hypothetical protein
MSDGYEYYELKHVKVPDSKPGDFRMASAAFRDCGLCARPISSSGGPGSGSICVSCAEIVKSGRARGAIKYGSDPQ